MSAGCAPWIRMWVLAVAVFGSFKLLTWMRAGRRRSAPAWISAGYLLSWPGMDADAFFDSSRIVDRPKAREWLQALVCTMAGAALIWILPRSVRCVIS